MLFGLPGMKDAYVGIVKHKAGNQWSGMKFLIIGKIQVGLGDIAPTNVILQ